MKNTLRATLLLLTLSGIAYAIQGCTDPCGSSICVNGDCQDGGCECHEGWTGEDCDLERTPTTITVENVHVLHFPQEWPFDGQYDKDGTGPDFMFSIQRFSFPGPNETLHRSDEFYENAINSQDYTFKVGLPVTDFNAVYHMVLHEADTLLNGNWAASSFSVATVGTNFYDMVRGESFPPSDTISSKSRYTRNRVLFKVDFSYSFE